MRERRLLEGSVQQSSHRSKHKHRAKESSVSMTGRAPQRNKRTETICAIAERTAMAPNSDPTSDPEPQAWRQTAPSECKEGFPPEVNDERQESAINEYCAVVGVTATKKSAKPSTAREHRARFLSNRNSAAIYPGGGTAPAATGNFGLK